MKHRFNVSFNQKKSYIPSYNYNNTRSKKMTRREKKGIHWSTNGESDMKTKAPCLFWKMQNMTVYQSQLSLMDQVQPNQLLSNCTFVYWYVEKDWEYHKFYITQFFLKNINRIRFGSLVWLELLSTRLVEDLHPKNGKNRMMPTSLSFFK